MKRTIAAILAADVAGYSRLMAEDEEDTLSRLAAAKAVFGREVDHHSGRIFNTAGDAVLAEFPSAVEALRAGIAIQTALDELDRNDPPERRVRFRMGLNIGDVVQVEGDLLGDGVNIAARLEGIAEPGGICVSRNLYEAVSGKVRVGFRDMGQKKLKNIPRPIIVFRVLMPHEAHLAATPRGLNGIWMRRAGACAGVLAAVAGFGWVWHAGMLNQQTLGAPSTDDELNGPMAVSVTQARRACLPNELRLTGLLVPRHLIDVRAERESPRIARVMASALDVVQEGQVLSELQAPDGQDGRSFPVKSPVAGLVVRAEAKVDAPATALAAPLFQIAAGSVFEMEAQVPLAVLDRLAPGQQATVSGFSNTPRPAHVRTVSREIDPATQLGRVRLQLDEAVSPASPVRAGEFASALVRLGQSCGVVVPAPAIRREAEGAIVFVANRGKVDVRGVTTGLTTTRDVEVRSGLDEGDTVVTRAGAFLREGDAVKPIRAAEP